MAKIEKIKYSNLQHGLSRTPTFRSWDKMIQRCENPKDTNFGNYGGRRIKVCSEWHSFASFHRDMGIRPDGTTLERKNVNGNYEPSNCRWATGTEQARNRRDSHFVEFRGERRVVSEWEEVLGFNPNVIRSRLRLGWSVERAMQHA